MENLIVEVNNDFLAFTPSDNTFKIFFQFLLLLLLLLLLF